MFLGLFLWLINCLLITVQTFYSIFLIFPLWFLFFIGWWLKLGIWNRTWTQFWISLLFWFFILTQLSLHVLNGLWIQLTFDTGHLIQNTEIFKELIQCDHALLQIIDAHALILVEVKSKPARLRLHLYIWVCVVHIANNLFLFVKSNLNKCSDLLHDAIVQKEDLFDYWFDSISHKIE
jgi:hypothetical protein